MPPRIAYLTTAYPYVSHTFIRREILGLERLGYDVTRVAIRAGDAVVDAEDAPELVIPGENGWLANTADANGLARAIIEADATPTERLREMGAAGQARIRAEHCSGEIDKLDALFRRYVAHEETREVISPAVREEPGARGA